MKKESTWERRDLLSGTFKALGYLGRLRNFKIEVESTLDEVNLWLKAFVLIIDNSPKIYFNDLSTVI